jgi:hypothetical protein
MGSIVNIYKGPPGARVLEGQAELIEVQYKGGARYRVRCVFVDDPQRRVRVREWDIEEKPVQAVPMDKGIGDLP